MERKTKRKCGKHFFLFLSLLCCSVLFSILRENKAFAYTNYINNPQANIFYFSYYSNGTITNNRSYGTITPPLDILSQGYPKYLYGFRFTVSYPNSWSYGPNQVVDISFNVMGHSSDLGDFGRLDAVSAELYDTGGSSHAMNCSFVSHLGENPSYVAYTCRANASGITPSYALVRVGESNNATSSTLAYASAEHSKLTLSFIGIGLDVVADPNTAILQQQVEQNQTIINQNQTIINQNQQTQDFITDDTEPNPDTNNLPSVGLLPAGPLDSLLGLPLTLMTNISNALGGSCTGLNIPLPYINDNLTIPCFDTIFYSGDFAPLATIVGGSASAVILFYWLKHLYKKVDRAISMETTEEDTWGVL